MCQGDKNAICLVVIGFSKHLTAKNKKQKHAAVRVDSLILKVPCAWNKLIKMFEHGVQTIQQIKIAS